MYKENLKSKGAKERQEIMFKNRKRNKSRRRKNIEKVRSFREKKGKIKICRHQTKGEVERTYKK